MIGGKLIQYQYDLKWYTFIISFTPAKDIKKRFSDEKIELLLELQWWNWDEKKIFENIEELASANDLDTLKSMLVK